MQPVYLILPTSSIGGAEKRFIEIWGYLQRQHPSLHLVISKQFQDNNTSQTLKSIIQQHAQKVHVYTMPPQAGVYQFQKELYRFVKTIAPKNALLHFIVSFPALIYPFAYKNTLYSFTESSLQNVNIKGKIMYLLNMLRARRCDVLDPLLYKKMSRLFFFKKKQFSLTPGSFVNTEIFYPVPAEQKQNWLVFLGRFYPMKQVVPLLKAIPEIYRQLAERKLPPGLKFIFIGYGLQEEEMLQLLQQPQYKNLPVELIKTTNAEEILNRSKIFFSLQLNNNYPSKSLLEGMAAGNIPVVTDVGTTRLLAQPPFSYYVPEHFSADELAQQVLQIFSLTQQEQANKYNTARKHVTDNFSIHSSANYFMQLYNARN